MRVVASCAGWLSLALAACSANLSEDGGYSKASLPETRLFRMICEGSAHDLGSPLNPREPDAAYDDLPRHATHAWAIGQDCAFALVTPMQVLKRPRGRSSVPFREATSTRPAEAYQHIGRGSQCWFMPAGAQRQPSGYLTPTLTRFVHEIHTLRQRTSGGPLLLGLELDQPLSSDSSCTDLPEVDTQLNTQAPKAQAHGLDVAGGSLKNTEVILRKETSYSSAANTILNAPIPVLSVRSLSHRAITAGAPIFLSSRTSKPIPVAVVAAQQNATLLLIHFGNVKNTAHEAQATPAQLNADAPRTHPVAYKAVDLTCGDANKTADAHAVRLRYRDSMDSDAGIAQEPAHVDCVPQLKLKLAHAGTGWRARSSAMHWGVHCSQQSQALTKVDYPGLDHRKAIRIQDDSGRRWTGRYRGEPTYPFRNVRIKVSAQGMAVFEAQYIPDFATYQSAPDWGPFPNSEHSFPVRFTWQLRKGSDSASCLPAAS